MLLKGKLQPLLSLPHPVDGLQLSCCELQVVTAVLVLLCCLFDIETREPVLHLLEVLVSGSETFSGFLEQKKNYIHHVQSMNVKMESVWPQEGRCQGEGVIVHLVIWK